MKPIENTTGVERVTNTLLGTAAAAVATAFTKKLLGKPKRKAKRTKRQSTAAKQAQAVAAPAGEEVRHG